MLKKYLLSFVATTLLVTGAYAAGTSDTTATVTVANSIDITTNFTGTIAANLNVLNGTFTGGTTDTFTLKANSDATTYNVWLTVPTANWDSTNTQVSAINDTNATYKLPIIATLTGTTGNVSGDGTGTAGTGVSVTRTIEANSNVTPAASATQADGLGVNGTDVDGDLYTITITPDSAQTAAAYKNIPNGTYSVIMTVNTLVTN